MNGFIGHRLFNDTATTTVANSVSECYDKMATFSGASEMIEEKRPWPTSM
jgi:hypothetical protein